MWVEAFVVATLPSVRAVERGIPLRIIVLVAACFLAACTDDEPSGRSSIHDGGGADECRAQPGATALCLQFEPEAITPEAELGLDERGTLNIEVFDRPNTPGGAAASVIALYDATLPSGSDAELSLAHLPHHTVVLTDPPSIVYVRALFFDNEGFSETGALTWGTWLGGMDLQRGIVEDTSLVPVTLQAGEMTPVQIPLRALRRLSVSVTTSATPLGDGEGALSVVASPVAALPPNVPTFGYGIDPCVDVTRGPQTVEMILLGSGKFYVTGYFDDLGIQTPGAIPPGTLLSLRNVDYSTGQATYDDVTVGDTQYAASLAIDLGYVTAFPGDPSSIGPNSCADLGLPGTP